MKSNKICSKLRKGANFAAAKNYDDRLVSTVDMEFFFSSNESILSEGEEQYCTLGCHQHNMIKKVYGHR